MPRFPFQVSSDVPVFLAPMAGVSEAPFRQLCRRMGADVVLSEFLSSEAIRRRMALEHPGVEVAGAIAPPFKPALDAAESRELVAAINAARPDVLWVGMTAPKQELWIHRHAERLAPAVAIGVGASLAFVAGTLPRAPRWMARSGLEWVHRLGREPRRLWRRYFDDARGFLPILARSLRASRAPPAT